MAAIGGSDLGEVWACVHRGEVAVGREDKNALRVRTELINLCAIWALHNIRDENPCSYNLTGESFKRWVGGTVGEKFEIVRDTMPPRDERSLPDEVYLDILVFILRANKVPVGSHELKPEPETLKQITISEPG